MELIRALRLDQVKHLPRVAFVGAGGKTTAMFQCARQLAGPVLVTASTHLAVDQLNLGDQHYVVDDFLLDQLKKEIPAGITLLTGSLERDSRQTLGVAAGLMERIYAFAEAYRIPMLIEADGSRQLPLKAPAAHEPPIPEFVDHVVVVAGLKGLDRPLTPEQVHRPEIFAKLSGLLPGELIRPKSLARVLLHVEGGLKNVPVSARRVALLNQADTPELQGKAAVLTSELLPDFDAVVVSSLTSTQSVIAVNEPIAAVILAAGEARRFGSPKQLLDWHGKPLVWHVAQKALQGGLNPVIVVCGQEIDAIQEALTGLPVEFVHNLNWQQGQGTSVKAGTELISAQNGGILFLLADQPQIPVSLIRSLVEKHAQNLEPIIGPFVDGQRANPVLQ
jgi:molybdenum cofactor cytidylyltransferase